MKKISLIAMGVISLGWVSAHAQTGGTAAGSTGAPTGPGSGMESSDATAPPPPAVPTDASTGTYGAAPYAQPAPVQPLGDQETPARAPGRISRLGAAVLVGGGFEDFTNGNLKNMTGGGGYWNARAVAGTHQYMGLEAAYVGAARSIDTLGLNPNAALVSNGVEGALRVNVPILQGRSLIEPFGFVGLGWQHYNVTNTNTNTSDVADKDDIMTLPYGGGLEFAYGRLLADARFTYRQTYMNDLLRTTGGKLNNWGVGAQLGVGF